MTAETPVLDTLADITAASLEHNSLVPREVMLARIAALIAVDAPPASYLANAGAAADSGVTADDIQAVMIGIAQWLARPGSSPRAAISSRLWLSKSWWPRPGRSRTRAPGSEPGLPASIQASSLVAGPCRRSGGRTASPADGAGRDPEHPVLRQQPVRRLALTRLPGRCEDEYGRRSLPGTAAAKGLPPWTD